MIGWYNGKQLIYMIGWYNGKQLISNTTFVLEQIGGIAKTMYT